jgi:hypothetical protein
MDMSCRSDNVTVTWTAVLAGTSIPAGSFPGGNTGTSVQWTAPEVGGDTDVTITATVDDTGTIEYDDSSASDSSFITVKASDCNSIYQNGIETPWENFDTSGLADCSGLLPCSGTGGVQWEDSCGNHVEIKCCGSGGGGGGLLGCAYRVIINGNIITKCIWETEGGNCWKYRTIKTACGLYALSEIRHVNQDLDCDEGCSGKSCAIITIYDHITHGKTQWWRRVDCNGGTPWRCILDETDGEHCPGHTGEI